MIFLIRSSLRFNNFKYQKQPNLIFSPVLFNHFCNDKSLIKQNNRPMVLPEDLDIPEPPTTCCMSGCPNCVWMEYAEKLTKMFEDGGVTAQREIMEKVTDSNMRAFLSIELRNLQTKKS